MDLNEFIASQKKLAHALYKLDILVLEELLRNGADLLTECDIINKNQRCLKIIVESLSKEGFKELCKVFMPYLIQNYNIIYTSFINDTLQFCSQLITKDNVAEIIWSNLEYLQLILHENRISDDSMIFNFLCKCQDYRNQTFSSKNLILMLETFSMINSNIKWNYKGHRSMTPLHVAATLDLLEPKTLLDLGIAYGGDINATDIFGQTILHTACSWKNFYFVQAVMSYGPSLKVSKDVFGWTPLCIAIKGTRYCQPISLKFAKREVPDSSFELLKGLLLSETGKSMTKQEIDLSLLVPVKNHCENECTVCFGGKPSYRRNLAKHIKENYAFLTEFISQDFDKYMQEREKSSLFIERLLTSKYVGVVDFEDRNNAIIHDEVLTLMKKVEIYINQKDKLFHCQLTVAGSVAEDTKTRAPDEFDINFRLLDFNLSNPILGDQAALFFNLNKNSLSPEELRYTIVYKKGTIITWNPVAIKKKLLSLVNDALSLESTWKGLNLYWRTYIIQNLQTPHLVWTSKEFYPEMSISLDIMPIFRLPSWPDRVLAEHLNGNADDEILKQDCLIIIKNDKFYISASTIELYMMRKLPAELKYAYITCKILMNLLLYSPKLENLDDYFIENLLPSSYELKNIVIQLYLRFIDRNGSQQQKDRYLEQCNAKRTPEVYCIHNLTNDQLFSISVKCQEILERIEQLDNCVKVSSGSFLFCKYVSEDCVCNSATYKYPKFLLSDDHAMYIRVYQIKSLELRKNLKKLLF